MQKRFWNWKDDDLTAQINQWMLGVLEPGLYRGFDGVLAGSGFNLTLQHDSTGVLKVETDLSYDTWGVYLTKQGTIVTESSAIVLPIDPSLGVNPRIDTIVATHNYSDTVVGGTPALYSVIKGTPASNPVPATIGSTLSITILGYLLVTADATTDFGSSVYTKEAIPTLANGDPLTITSPNDSIQVTSHSGGVVNVDSKTSFYNNYDLDWLVKTGVYEITFSSDAARISANCPVKALQITLEITGRLVGTADYGTQTITARVDGDIVVYKRDYTRPNQSTAVTGAWVLQSNPFKVRSYTSLAIGTLGSPNRDFEFNAPWDDTFGFKVKAYSLASPSNYMIGTLVAQDTGFGEKTWRIIVDTLAGSGTFADWVIVPVNDPFYEQVVLNNTNTFPNAIFDSAELPEGCSTISVAANLVRTGKIIVLNVVVFGTISNAATFNSYGDLSDLVLKAQYRQNSSFWCPAYMAAGTSGLYNNQVIMTDDGSEIQTYKSYRSGTVSDGQSYEYKFQITYKIK